MRFPKRVCVCIDDILPLGIGIIINSKLGTDGPIVRNITIPIKTMCCIRVGVLSFAVSLIGLYSFSGIIGLFVD